MEGWRAFAAGWRGVLCGRGWRVEGGRGWWAGAAYASVAFERAAMTDGLTARPDPSYLHRIHACTTDRPRSSRIRHVCMHLRRRGGGFLPAWSKNPPPQTSPAAADARWHPTRGRVANVFASNTSTTRHGVSGEAGGAVARKCSHRALRRHARGRDTFPGSVSARRLPWAGLGVGATPCVGWPWCQARRLAWAGVDVSDASPLGRPRAGATPSPGPTSARASLPAAGLARARRRFWAGLGPAVTPWPGQASAWAPGLGRPRRERLAWVGLGVGASLGPVSAWAPRLGRPRRERLAWAGLGVGALSPASPDALSDAVLSASRDPTPELCVASPAVAPSPAPPRPLRGGGSAPGAARPLQARRVRPTCGGSAPGAARPPYVWRVRSRRGASAPRVARPTCGGSAPGVSAHARRVRPTHDASATRVTRPLQARGASAPGARPPHA